MNKNEAIVKLATRTIGAIVILTVVGVVASAASKK
jgi:hypothetical protein